MFTNKRRVAPTADKKSAVNGLYIHSSPPRVLNVNSAHIRQLIRSGDLDKLEQLVLEGQGKKLIGEYSADYKIRSFIKTVPTLMSKINLLHDAVSGGSLEELQSIIQEDCSKRKKLVLCKDQSGIGLLHKAIYYDLGDIVKWLIENYPQTVTVKDVEGRTPAHYIAMCKDPREMQRLLTAAGADLYATDSHGHNYKYYMDNAGELELPSAHKSAAVNGTHRNGASKDSLVIKPSNIRIWIHQRDLGRLQKVLWEGHGAKLRTETSNNARVRKFLEAVPYLMGAIKEIHLAAVNNDIGLIKDRTSEPVPPIILSSKDSNGLNALHKAAGLGHVEVAQYIAETYPKTVTTGDAEGRTPLHYAAILKDGDEMYNMLIGAGAEESTLDNRQKTAAYYKTRPNEIDSKLLQVIPDAPRTASSAFPASWDWNLLSDSSGESKKSELVSRTTPVEETKVIEEVVTNNNEEPEVTLEQEAVEKEDEPPSKEEEIEKTEMEEITTEPEVESEVNANEDSEAVLQQNGEEHEEAEEVEPSENENVEVLEIEFEETEEPENKEDEAALSYKSDENENIEDEEPKYDTPESQKVGVIEGVVNGEDEVETLNNDENNEEPNRSFTSDDEDSEISELVESGNMEQLALLVLNGEGNKLVGQHSNNPEIQAFLENVPIYMSKINRVHIAARDGSLRDLQAALDRRKFAIAKDPISPNGTSPLHVATVFGNTSIVRYLAGRFPETLQVQDDNDRTPLHYAATLADNGHYYNLLLHLGAHVNILDKFGHDAEYYRTNNEEFSHRKLLLDFGAHDETGEMLMDKDDDQQPTVDIPLFRTEEGRYLATSLGDPLIKGLTEVANKRPDDPIAYLATYLYNFANNNKDRIRTQENLQNLKPATAQNAQPTSIDIVTLDPEELNGEDSDIAFSASSRDEHGQSMLHFAAARSHGRNALFQLLQESDINIGYRDELYRTCRDVSIQANVPENTHEIDRYVVFVAAKGDTDKLVELLLEGYDHIIDVIDEDETPITEVVGARGQTETVSFLHSILAFEERRERVHHSIRQGILEKVREMLADENETGSGKLLAMGKNSYGRCTLHIAVLCQQEEIVDYLANTFPETLYVGDNLERTALHYAMGVEKVESISRVLIKAGAKRVMKDLKGRQASYYFMNKSDILRLQEEEETF
ncbi:uncharacterized protein CBL_00355 [Carabus blaptoides fortunei]